VGEVYAFSPPRFQLFQRDRIGFAYEECDFAVFPVALHVPAINALHISIAVAFLNHE
jgi:hypothetical protein